MWLMTLSEKILPQQERAEVVFGRLQEPSINLPALDETQKASHQRDSGT